MWHETTLISSETRRPLHPPPVRRRRSQPAKTHMPLLPDRSIRRGMWLRAATAAVLPPLVASSCRLLHHHHHRATATTATTTIRRTTTALASSSAAAGGGRPPHPRRRPRRIVDGDAARRSPGDRDDDAFGATRTSTRRFRASGPLGLNRILFDAHEIDDDDDVDCDDIMGRDDAGEEEEEDARRRRRRRPLATVTLPKDDYRTVHVAKVLGLRDGDSLRAGAVRGRRRRRSDRGRVADRVDIDIDDIDDDDDDGGAGEVGDRRRDRLAGLLTDYASVSWLPEGRVKKAEPTRNGDPPGSLRLTIPRPPMTSLWEDRVGRGDDDDVPRVSLLLALPRPLQLRRILPMASQLGIDRIILANARKVPRDYFGSSIFRRPETLRGLLVEGLSISGDVALPDVIVTRKLKSFLEDDLDDMFPSGEVARVIAHPRRIGVVAADEDDDNDEDRCRSSGVTRRMTDVVFPNDGVDGSPRRMLVAVGPEGGWEEPYELDMFAKVGFQRVSLGSRVLRSDVAVPRVAE
ncbi:hypothetical protein ACHAW5_004310 [Stephanodiscus triporus]|uniref:Ribosomal RNA small subunit methyltransferase E methyltransferase domain-containing protein n=1 Tax=Stephanodiscus triporus TaxID=2934178 RepID=A0ABD3QJJ5_9STRA